jgi:hypothetical protein
VEVSVPGASGPEAVTETAMASAAWASTAPRTFALTWINLAGPKSSSLTDRPDQVVLGDLPLYAADGVGADRAGSSATVEGGASEVAQRLEARRAAIDVVLHLRRRVGVEAAGHERDQGVAAEARVHG